MTQMIDINKDKEKIKYMTQMMDINKDKEKMHDLESQFRKSKNWN